MVENQNYGPLVRGTERSARWYIAERLPQNEFHESFSNVPTCVRQTFLAEIANSLKDNLRLCFHPR